MKTFTVERKNDESGISGIGIVLNGVVFSSGTTVIEWNTSKQPKSIGIYTTYEDFIKLHVLSHPTNNTKVVWDNGDVEQY